jgi:hypothetical protein
VAASIALHAAARKVERQDGLRGLLRDKRVVEEEIERAWEGDRLLERIVGRMGRDGTG